MKLTSDNPARRPDVLTDENGGETITTTLAKEVVDKMSNMLTANQMKSAIDELENNRLNEFKNIFAGIQCIKDWSGLAPNNGYVILCGPKFYEHLQKQQSK